MSNTLLAAGNIGGLNPMTGVRPISIASLKAAVTRRPRRGVLAGRGEAPLVQPQDGAYEARTKVATIKPRTLMSLQQEPEDALLTGGTRSLTRRLLGLNMGKKQIAKPSAVVAGPITRTRVA